MNILLYNPDNGVTRNFMPHLWMFLLQSLTPSGHHVYLIDGNAQPYSETEFQEFIRANEIGLVGIGAMTRMAARSYRMADAARSAGALVVMGGPHVTEVPDEALGRDGGPRHVDAVALGEADATWPRIVEDAAKGELREVYSPVDDTGKEIKPSLQDYPRIPWDRIDLKQFDLIAKLPPWARFVLQRIGMKWESLAIVPMESGRGCPYNCDFCTVTGFFGDSIRFRTNESVVNEMLLIKERAEKEKGKMGLFFIDDNFAINVKRTKSLLQEVIRRDAILPWVAQISINLLRDEELLDLIQASGGRWIFIGLESIDAENLKEVHKGFNKPDEYTAILQRLADRGIYAITSFIFGMDRDQPGVAKRTTDVINLWPPGLPVFGLLTPYPATPLYDRLREEGRLTRPKHWLDFRPFRMAFSPKSIKIEEAEAEVREAWTRCYDPPAVAAALKKIHNRPFRERAVLLCTRLLFRGIYFPQMTRSEWIRLLISYRQSILRILREGFTEFRRKKENVLPASSAMKVYNNEAIGDQ
ncbi:B12-binding domain-containing radical SAM protein [bacterium]|nr:B12-binding domain-containing radical SAM protein [bacterium]